MNIPRIVAEDNKLSVAGNFDFKISPAVVDTESFIPYRNISFAFGIETLLDAQYLMLKDTNETMIELIGEKLKQDFIEWGNTYSHKDLDLDVIKTPDDLADFLDNRDNTKD